MHSQPDASMSASNGCGKPSKGPVDVGAGSCTGSLLALPKDEKAASRGSKAACAQPSRALQRLDDDPNSVFTRMPVSEGVGGWRTSSSGSARRYWPFIQDSLVLSNTAALLVTRSRLNFCCSSSAGKISCAPMHAHLATLRCRRASCTPYRKPVGLPGALSTSNKAADRPACKHSRPTAQHICCGIMVCHRAAHCRRAPGTTFPRSDAQPTALTDTGGALLEHGWQAARGPAQCACSLLDTQPLSLTGAAAGCAGGNLLGASFQPCRAR